MVSARDVLGHHLTFNRAGNGVVTLTDSHGLSTTYNLGIPAGQ